jgi:Protein of unknown function (DUF2510)
MGAVVVLCWIASAALGYFIGRTKGREVAGLLLGLGLGLIGVVIILLLRPKSLATAPSDPASLPRWGSDPYHRHQLRWWNGIGWTEQVSDNGVGSVDPVGIAPPPPPFVRQ